ncbi:MAG TPA: effector-associated domain EAD1-containing protein [Streptosporangiaceae bacterium]|nr:effector-associated domain EAD1-containing protein [Streptosporangiaceae bacterium]
MSEAESVKQPDPERDPSLPLQDIRFTLADRRDLLAELAEVFANQRAVEMILRSTDFPRARIPAFENSFPEEVWGDILLEIDHGVMRAGNYQLLTAVCRPYPGNVVFQRLAQTYLRSGQRPRQPAQEPVQQAEPPEPPARPEPAAQPQPAVPEQRSPAAEAPQQEPAEPPACHIIVRASSEEEREQALMLFRDLGLDPVEQWSTAHAVSYRVGSDRPNEVRSRLRDADFGWTVVAPGLRDYLLHTLYIEGPDGRRFRITDAPAQQTVGNVAAEVVDEYSPDLPDASRPAVVDHVGPDGQGRRLDPNSTLDESGVRDGDRMRVGFQARAAAMNPLERQDALYRVRNQIRDFGESRDAAVAFVVRANSTLMPTEYELEFTQPSFGPPPSPELPPVDIDRHVVLIQLGSDFPTSPPAVYWLTQIYHPNVFPTYECEASRGRESQMGLVCLGALSESYLPGLHFGSLCQMLIDIAAFRNYSLYKADGTVDATGALRMQVDFFDKYAAAWVRSADGQRRIEAIKGSPIGDVPRRRPEYRNVIERIGGE